MISRTADGYYIPSYFSMTIESLSDVEEAIDRNNSTFVHEYIHYLQDLILPYCIRNTMLTNRDFSVIASKSYQSGRISRPFIDWDEDTQLTNIQRNVTWGCTRFVEEVSSFADIREDFFEQNGKNLYFYTGLLDDGTEYQIGARDFLEYIAYKIENRRWGGLLPDLPYRAVDLVFDYYGFSEISPEIRIALIEYSLYNDNPMRQLMKLFGFFENKRHLLVNLKVCIHTLLSLGWESRGGFRESIFSKTARRLKDLSESLKGVFRESQLPVVSRWIDHIVEYSGRELSNRFLFTELFGTDITNFFEIINKLIKDIGIPLVFNYSSKCVSLLPKEFEQKEFAMVHAMKGFVDYCTSSVIECPLLSFCTNNSDGIVNENCRTNPPLRAKEPGLCLFGVTINQFALHEIVWS